jgi:siroheme synthase
MSEASPTTVPLTNGSEWLIFKRRFIFQYPPKDQRAKLMATPHKKSRKSLRMSMINAAQLWTPSAPKTQAESWGRLKSPVQPFPGEKGSEITLVEGDPVHFSHNQEEVIVVESVDSPTPSEPEIAPPASARKTQQTPSKRGPQNLHKQVLLMNSHRKHVKNIDELEEREVEESILVENNSDEELEKDAASNPRARTQLGCTQRLFYTFRLN